MLIWYFMSCFCIALLEAYPTGAPLSTCDTMLPLHRPYSAQNSPSPYVITVSKTLFTVGENVTVAISSPFGNSFKGFLIKALPSGVNSGVAGQFTNNFPYAHYLDCGNLSQSAVTHSDPSNKTSITLFWTTDQPGVYSFKATVVESFTPFWVGFNSELITVQ
ncbi:hypothetical protein CHUAL_009391 [Chamberlinius hualienensis]